MPGATVALIPQNVRQGELVPPIAQEDLRQIRRHSSLPQLNEGPTLAYLPP